MGGRGVLLRGEMGEWWTRGNQVVWGVSCCRSCDVMCLTGQNRVTETPHLMMLPILSYIQISCGFPSLNLLYASKDLDLFSCRKESVCKLLASTAQ